MEWKKIIIERYNSIPGQILIYIKTEATPIIIDEIMSGFLLPMPFISTIELATKHEGICKLKGPIKTMSEFSSVPSLERITGNKLSTPKYEMIFPSQNKERIKIINRNFPENILEMLEKKLFFCVAGAEKRKAS